MTTAPMKPSLFPLEVPMPSKEETSLSSKAMLCTVSISAWSGYKFDREASEEIAQIHGARQALLRRPARPSSTPIPILLAEPERLFT